MITIDFKVPMLNLKGEPHTINDKEVLLCDELIEQLSLSSGEITARKAIGWARAMTKGESLVLDSDDFGKLYEFIKSHKNLTNLYKEDLHVVMDDAKAKAEKK